MNDPVKKPTTVYVGIISYVNPVRVLRFRQIEFRIFGWRPDASAVLVLVVVAELVENVPVAFPPVVDLVHHVLLQGVQLVERDVEVLLQLADNILQGRKFYSPKHRVFLEGAATNKIL